jgi:hypothetical protein
MNKVWLQIGVALEDEQSVLHCRTFFALLTVCRSQLCRLGRRLTKHPNPQLAKQLAGRRRRLQTKIDAYLDKTPISIASLLPKDQSATPRSNLQIHRQYDPLEDEEDSNDNIDRDGYDDEIPHDEDEVEDDDHIDTEDSKKSLVGIHCHPEHIILPLPSCLGLNKQQDHTIAALVEDEVAIRESQAVEALEQLRLSLGLKSAIFRNNVAMAHTQYKKTKAWKAVTAADVAVRRHARSYGLAQHALVQLQVHSEILKRFPPLQKDDLAVSRDVLEENRLGQRSEHVGWIWRLNIGNGLGDDEWMQESE